jgi:hypothetical protein
MEFQRGARLSKAERMATSLLTLSMSMKTASFSRAASPGSADSAWFFSGSGPKAQPAHFVQNIEEVFD